MVQQAPQWPAVTSRTAALFREGCQQVLDPRTDWLDELHAAALGGDLMRPVAADPVLAAATRQANLANLFAWASANVTHPGRRVPANTGPEVLAIARDLVRRGLDESGLDAYRTGQNLAWRRWMDICFGLTDDVDELRQLLDVSALSISTFIDDTLARVLQLMDAERAELTRGASAERRAAVTLLLEGAPISRSRAEGQLGYGLTGPHTAAILWSGAGSDQLEAAAEGVMRAAGAGRRLTVVASAASLWVWLPTRSAPGVVELVSALAGSPDVRVAVGRPGDDIDGFRRSHLDAAATQRMLSRLTSSEQVARYEDVALVTLLTADPGLAAEFVADALGALADADDATRATVLAYVHEGCSATRAAARLYTHRNTVLRRLARADELLPRPLAGNVLAVGAALEVLRWRE